MRVSLAGVLLISVALSACGGGDTPTGTPPDGNGNGAGNSLAASITVSGPNTVVVGSTITLQANAQSSSGTPLQKSFIWASNAPAVATVSASGVVTGVGEGSAIVSASVDGKTAGRTITVLGTVATVAISGPQELNIGRSLQYTASAVTAGGQNVSSTFNWSTSNSAVATVSATGLVAAVGIGTTTISAQSTVNGTIGSVNITVSYNNISSLIEAVREQHGLPALAAAIVTRSSGITSIGVSGNRRIGGPPVTLNDKWHIGSNLKGITASLAAVAVTRGQLTWGTTVESMFPELGSNIRAEYRTVTLKELLSMSAGIRSTTTAQTYIGTTAREQRESAVAWALANGPQAGRGNYLYSNASYIIAGAMIERAMNGTYENLLVTELGTPLGATQIGFGPTTSAGGNDQPVGHTWSNGWVACEACDNPPGLSAAGRVHMSISDWAKITHGLMQADFGSSNLISRANAREVFSNVTATPDGEYYGLGWIMLERSWGGRTATHTGSNLSNHSVAWVGLDNGIAIIAVTNAANEPTTAAALDDMVSRLLTLHQSAQANALRTQ